MATAIAKKRRWKSWGWGVSGGWCVRGRVVQWEEEVRVSDEKNFHDVCSEEVATRGGGARGQQRARHMRTWERARSLLRCPRRRGGGEAERARRSGGGGGRAGGAAAGESAGTAQARASARAFVLRRRANMRSGKWKIGNRKRKQATAHRAPRRSGAPPQAAPPCRCPRTARAAAPCGGGGRARSRGGRLAGHDSVLPCVWVLVGRARRLGARLGGRGPKREMRSGGARRIARRPAVAPTYRPGKCVCRQEPSARHLPTRRDSEARRCGNNAAKGSARGGGRPPARPLLVLHAAAEEDDDEEVRREAHDPPAEEAEAGDAERGGAAGGGAGVRGAGAGRVDGDFPDERRGEERCGW